MHKRLYVLTLLLLLLSSNAFGDGSKTKAAKTVQQTNIKDQAIDRIKRSSNYDENDGQFWANRGKRQAMHKVLTKDNVDEEFNNKNPNLDYKLYNKPTFWGNRGRRSSEESYNDVNYFDIVSGNNDYDGFNTVQRFSGYQGLKDRREHSLPFRDNRGRRNSKEISDDNDIDPFWSSRGRRQEEEPFWGTRGRRENNLPFWGNRGKRHNEPFWGSRGRRDGEPFWGTRGRRQDDEPFWGNRGKKEEEEPFWGNRGKKEIDGPEPFWGNRGRRKEDLRESIKEAISKVENDIECLSKLKKGSASELNGHFWENRGRNSQLKYLFDDTRIKNRHEIEAFKTGYPYELIAQPSVSSTMLEDRIYADQPHYILVERNSRSSAESLDPYYISRGKKNNFYNTSRGRRNAIEEIVKSVRNDPFYIARGKRDFHDNQAENNKTHDEFLKAKELICATIQLTLMKKDVDVEVKREINEDRDRRYILKKLAAQLQNDPYFVSRGKKNGTNENQIEEFVSQVAVMCN